MIAEAALGSGTFLVRVDILIRDGQRIELIEVKSKSVKNADVQKRFVALEWRPYVYDIAFQSLVAERVFPGYTIVPKLLLVDPTSECNISGLHQYFQVVPDVRNGTVEVRVTPGFNRQSVAALNILREEDVSDVVQRLKTTPLTVLGAGAPHNAGLQSFMDWAAGIQQAPNAFFGGVSKLCKSCEFRAQVDDDARSGVHECWRRAIDGGMLESTGDPADRRIPLSVDIWAGGAGPRSIAGDVVGARRAFIFDVTPNDVGPATTVATGEFTPFERRVAQVNAWRGGPAVALREPRLAQMDIWEWPLHMIDFETSTPALPFFQGMRPYETLAFQFSHHIMERVAGGSVRVRHATQWISVDAAAYPNVEFVRALRRALMPEGELHGTVFRYHNHENAVLRVLRRVIDAGQEADRDQLLSFIDLVTKPSDAEAKQGVQAGRKAMVDLHRLVQEGYYSKVAGGSISLKYILPAILHDAPGVAVLFARAGVFGSAAVSSQNFREPNGHIWLQAARGNDPYKTLPPIFQGQHADMNDMLARLAGDDIDATINQGGLAMTAWNFTQFAELSDAERVAIKDALLRYCELDTLAMVMLTMGLFELRGRPLRLMNVN